MESNLIVRIVSREINQSMRKIATIFIENNVAIMKSRYSFASDSSEKTGLTASIKIEDHSAIPSIRKALLSINEVENVTIKKINRHSKEKKRILTNFFEKIEHFV